MNVPVGVVAWASWTADVGAPDTALLPSTGGPTRLLDRMAAHVLGELVERGGLDITRLAIVHATANAESGRLARLVGHRSFSTSVRAGITTVAMGLLEAIGVLGTVADQVAVVWAEDAGRASPTPGTGYDALAAALLLRVTDDAPWQLRDLSSRPAPPPVVPAPFAHSPCGPALTLVRALRCGSAGTIALEHGAGARRARWCVDLESETMASS